MQETRYFDEHGQQQKLLEVFSIIQRENSGNDAIKKLYEKMNNRLFELENEGHVLVKQKVISLSEKLAIERAKKAKKKLNRMKRAVA